MKRITITLILIFVLLSNVAAIDYSENYWFVRDLINCLYRLQLAVLYNIKGQEEEIVIKNLHNQLPHFKEGKMFIKKWLESKNEAIKATAMGMYVNISEIESAVKDLINILTESGPIPDVSRYTAQEDYGWNKIFKTTSLALWVIMKPAESKEPQGKIPFIITDQERKSLIAHLGRMFGRQLEEYDRLKSRKKEGMVDEFELSVPVWSALQLRSLLTKQTYEEVKEGDFLSLER